MKNEVFVTRCSSFFPNQPVANDEMEDYLGYITGKPSRVKNIVLRQNGIVNRFYALDRQNQVTHTNAELAFESIKKLLKNIDHDEIEVLSCSSGNPDQLLPSHASMVHGLWKNKPLEVYSASGVCLSCLQAFKIAYMSVKSEESKNAICSTSELCSPTLLSKNYDIEYEQCSNVGIDPYMAFEKDFLRFMLSDGASAVLLENTPRGKDSMKVEWVDMLSYANELPTCMFMGAEKREDGELKGWKEFTSRELIERSVFTVKQDIRLLKEYVVKYFADFTEHCLRKYNVSASEIDYVIPHVSSMFFYHKLLEEFKIRGLDLGEEKWFTNLTTVGNIASAAIFAALDELWKTKELHSGEKILLLVPESGRFSYGAVLLTVV